jgi:hypothetical protein
MNYFQRRFLKHQLIRGSLPKIGDLDFVFVIAKRIEVSGFSDWNIFFVQDALEYFLGVRLD